MKKNICLMLVLIMSINSISNAFVTREMIVKEEKKIPISIVSNKMNTESIVDICEYENAEIVEMYVDNGDIWADINDDNLEIELDNGKYSTQTGNVIAYKNIFIEDKLTDEKRGTITIKTDEVPKEIINVDGDFTSGSINSKGEIVALVDKNLPGENGFDENEIEIGKIKVKVDSQNRDREVESKYFDTVGPVADKNNIKIKNISIDGKASVKVEDDKIKVSFSDGAPKLNETSNMVGTGFFWIDRNTLGKFITKFTEKIHPNSIYRADNYFFTGEGDFLGPEKLGKIEIEKDKDWIDYCGVNVDGIRYVYTEDQSLTPKDCVVLTKNKKEFSGQWFNTEKFDVEFTDKSVLFVPYGKLYSMGKIIKGTENWGEEFPNHEWEEKASFINPITGKRETYVKHLKFFYGPEERIAFGGYYTYPYECEVEYEHYKQVKKYSGSIEYSYEEKTSQAGYIYNGWIKIKYDKKKDLNDYPPRSPYAITYGLEELIWKPSKDDYTNSEKLLYEIESKQEEWVKIGETVGITHFNFNNAEETQIRIRARDEVGQYSEWGYPGEGNIEINADVTPQRIKAGEKIDIHAITKSISDVVCVNVKCDDLFRMLELEKESEKIPGFYEIAFKLLCDYRKESYIVATDEMFATNNNSKKEIRIRSFFSNAFTEQKTIDIFLPNGIEQKNCGTLIIPNQNYLGTPIDFTFINGSAWYIESGAKLNLWENGTQQEKTLINFYNDLTSFEVGRLTRVKVNPYVILNTLKKDDKGKEIYIKIPLESENAGQPFSITWEEKNGQIYLKLYNGTKLIYTEIYSKDIFMGEGKVFF